MAPETTDPVGFAVRACPFLHEVSVKQGEQYARNIAVNPTAPACNQSRRPVLEEVVNFNATLRFFHGATGVVPLRKYSAAEVPNLMSNSCSSTPAHAKQSVGRSHLPLASMSLSFGNMDFGDFFKKFGNQNRPQHKARKPQRKPQQPNSSSPSGQGPSNLSANGSNSSSAHPDGLCPMRKMLGPLAPFVFNAKGHLQCPEPIVKARAALAATKPVRDLRPQALPIKVLAIGATTAALNVPMGAWREHCKKFSVGWFIAVHATIPFIAMLRKAVIMPKYAIVFTIAAAVAGQAIGARLERNRLQKVECVEAVRPQVTSRVAVQPSAPASSGRSSPLASFTAAAVPRLQSAKQRASHYQAPQVSCGTKFVLEEERFHDSFLSGVALSAR